MSTATFERMLYTDCPAGGGRGGGNGFQVQAQSSGVEPDQVRMAVGSLLYATQAAWTSQDRPVAAYPLGFAHASDAGYGTGQSRYLGQEITGGRAGNHLADCLLTRDGDRYGSIRPAQLWRAAYWRGVPWDSIDCPAFTDLLEPGPLDSDAIAGWLSEAPDRALPLARLLSVLERDDGPQVMMVADEPDDALVWIAAATLLLPIRRAVDISFKVFVNNLNYADQRVCGVPRSLHPHLAPGQGQRWFVLDTRTGAVDEQEVSERATFWVQLLLGTDDPYDVVDALELAEVLGGSDRQAQADARQTAWAVTAPGEPLVDPGPLVRWLTQADDAELRAHGDAVAERIQEARPDADALRWIDRAFASGRLSGERIPTRHALLLAEVQEARAGFVSPPEPLDPVELGLDYQRDAESLVGSAILVESSDRATDALLRIALRHRLRLPLGPLRDRLHSFVSGWVANPRNEYRPDEWALRDEILDILHDELVDRLGRAAPAALVPVLRQVWRHLSTRHGDLFEPLSWQLRAAWIDDGADPDDRQARLRQAIGAQLPAGHRGEAPTGLQRALLDWNLIGGHEAMVMAARLPHDAHLEPKITELAMGAIEAGAQRPNLLLLTALDALYHRSGPPTGATVLRLWQSDQRMRQFVVAADAVKTARQGDRLHAAFVAPPAIDPQVVRAWLPELVITALDAPTDWLGALFLDVLGADLSLPFLRYWALELAGPRQVRAAVRAVVWFQYDVVGDELRTAIIDEIRAHLDRLDAIQRDQFVSPVYTQLRPELHKTWIALVQPTEAPHRRGLWRREKNG